MTPLAKGLGLLFGMPVLLGIGFFYYFLSTGEDRVRTSCTEITPGMPLATLVAYAQKKNLTLPDRETGVVFLGEARSFARHTCKVALDAGVVKSSAYHYAD